MHNQNMSFTNCLEVQKQITGKIMRRNNRKAIESEIVRRSNEK